MQPRSAGSTSSSSWRIESIVNSLKVRPDILNELEYNLLLCNTGKVRLSSHIIEDQSARYERKDPETLAALREIKALAVEMKNALLRGQLDSFGRMLHEEWAAQEADVVANFQPGTGFTLRSGQS